MQQALPWSGRAGPVLGIRLPHQQLRAVASTSCHATSRCCVPSLQQPSLVLLTLRKPLLSTRRPPCSPLRCSSRRGTRREAGRSDGWDSDEGDKPEASASASRPGKLESTAIPQAIRKRVEDAAEALGGRVTVGDVAARAGVSLGDAERTLNALAADAQGVLEVSEAGDVLWALPPNFRSIILGKSWLLRLEPVLAGARNAAGYLVRVSFGTTLVASIVLVTLTIIAVLTAAQSSERDDRRGGGYRGGYYGRSPVSAFINFSDLFYYWGPGYGRRRDAILRRPDEMTFFESIFSFVFGDGDPNAAYDDERWKLAGQYIQSRGGVVTAEQLAPYLDVTPADLERVDNSVSEAYMVPALVRFSGHPEVTEDGQLLYVFPSLQRTGRWQRAPPAPDKEAALERRWAFSAASEGQRLGAIALGAANLVGVLFLGNLLGDPAVTRALAQSSLGFMTGLFPFLQAYAAAFFAIPGLRWFLNKRRNVTIEARNQARLDALRGQSRPGLKRKLAAAKKLGESVVIRDRDIVYSSDRELSAQNTDAEADYFEQRLREREAARKQAAAPLPGGITIERTRQYEADL